MSKIQKLYKQGKLTVQQEFIVDVSYEVITGSQAYAIQVDDSDLDLVAICVSPIDYVFPYTVGGHIKGFGPGPQCFETFQQHHIEDDRGLVDVAIYDLVRFFHLAAENNPNLLDVLFSRDNMITHSDNIGKFIRQNRKLFLTKNSFYKMKSYAFAQLKKLETKNPNGKRLELVEKYGFDTKFASHIFRLCLQCQDVLVEHDMDLQRHAELLKYVRAGGYTLQEIKNWFTNKETELNDLYLKSTLRHSPDWSELTRVLLCCLEEKFGNLDKYISNNNDSRIRRKYEQICQIINA